MDYASLMGVAFASTLIGGIFIGWISMLIFIRYGIVEIFWLPEDSTKAKE